jgi:hypothetical protein
MPENQVFGEKTRFYVDEGKPGFGRRFFFHVFSFGFNIGVRLFFAGCDETA